MLIGLLLGGGVAGGLGWLLHRLGEDARNRAHEASCREQVKAAGKARDRARKETEQIDERLQRLRAEHEQCRGRVDGLKAELAGLATKLEEQAPALSSLESALSEKEARISGMEEASAVATVSIRALEQELAERTASLEAARTEIDEMTRAHAGCATTIARQKERIEELAEAVRERDRALKDGAPSWLLGSPNGSKDNLQAIRGLGPVLERDLNKLGIYHYKQIARLTSKEMDWLAARVKIFPGRIKKDRWIEQAKQLQGRGGRRR